MIPSSGAARIPRDSVASDRLRGGTTIYENSGASALGSLVFIILIIAVSVTISFVLIRAAVTQGMNAHYKTIHRHQATGEWRYSTDGKRPPLPIETPPGNSPI